MQVPSDQPRDPINSEEAIRHILMRLQITKLEAPGPFDNQSMPIAHFTGKSRSIDVSWDPNANSKIRGKLHLFEKETMAELPQVLFNSLPTMKYAGRPSLSSTGK
jgi:hypothetical protein